MPCANLILSNDTYDFVVSKDETINPLVEPVCIQPIDDQYEIWYFDRTKVPPLSIRDYSYTSIPKCFYLMDSTSMEVSGITAMQNNPTLSLKGQGVFVGIIDTGIDYTNALFKRADGSSRIFAMWDQSAGPRETNQENSEIQNRDIENPNMENPNNNNASGLSNTGDLYNYSPPSGFLYGIEYRNPLINQALSSSEPSSIVPEQDDLGHGTFLASLAAGNIDPDNNFVGAAPESDILVVKLKQAKQNVRDFFYLSPTTPIYQENDIMSAISYLNQTAEREGKPLVILIGVGSNQGSHAGSSPLSVYCNDIGAKRERCIVIPAGNQAAKRHHFFGEATSLLEPVRVEMDVEDNFPGFCMELWSFAPELVRAVVQSPTGQQSEGRFPITEETQTTRFVFENTTVTMDYRIAGRQRGDLVIFFRFSNVVKGIWTILVYPENAVTGAFHIWLPIREETEKDITFIRPNPDTTITMPSSARIPITVGGYNGLTDALYLESGRGFDALGGIKPDFCAPCVEVTGAGLRDNFVTYTGTSVAAAITAGACAQVFQWGVVQGNAPGMNSVEVKNTLIRGCRRDSGVAYPNREFGFGKLDVYQSFENLR